MRRRTSAAAGGKSRRGTCETVPRAQRVDVQPASSLPGATRTVQHGWCYRMGQVDPRAARQAAGEQGAHGRAANLTMAIANTSMHRVWARCRCAKRRHTTDLRLQCGAVLCIE